MTRPAIAIAIFAVDRHRQLGVYNVLVSDDGTKNPAPSRSGRLAGIDYGTVRIGVAIADEGVGIAVPLENYVRRSVESDAQHFVRLVANEGITRFVVGLPVHLDGRESGKSLEAREFGQWLGQATGVPVDFFDERFSTSQAERVLGEAKLTKKKRQARLDMLAAQIMLTAYLESHDRGRDPPRALDD